MGTTQSDKVSILRLRLSPTQLIPLSFMLVILLGAILLLLPVSSAPGQETDFTTALFTATTSVCVTGLVVVDTYAHWSLFGQFVILVLIQIGGLGVVAVGSMLMMLWRKKFFLWDRMLLGDSLNIDKSKGILRILVRIFRGAAIVEGAGALIYATRFVPLLGFGKGLWASLFQSVSAFCNAGMDVIGANSMADFNDSFLLMGTTMLLIILGGIGFVVWFDVFDGIRAAIRNRYGGARFISHLSEHTKLVFLMTATLIVAGAACIFFAEYNNPHTIGNMGLSDKILNSFFQSVTFRTAGFASFPQEKLTETSCIMGFIQMFIGGSPVGTAGGIKTVTAFLFFMNAFSYITNKKESVVFRRSVSGEMMQKASAVIFVSTVTLIVMTTALIAESSLNLTDALFEVTSALGTVGLSRAVTPTLDTLGRIIIILSMYLGRIGPISMAVFFVRSGRSANEIKHAEGTFYVG
ncbi:MAG: potassium transporter TrkH [Lachnospiraceae bacterium]|nr:potassium transporter TrkH [Lachnospiraceae bacterium]